MRARTLADPVAVALALLFTVVCVGTGLRAGYRLQDVDERVYHETLVSMRRGEGYYDAMRDALVRKEKAPPTQVRAIRPPTVYLFLSRFPASWWRWIVGAVYLAVMLLAWRLGRVYGDYGGPVAVVFAGVWCYEFSYYLFLHAEVWGLPFALGAALAVRSRKDGAGAGLAAVATIVRELYAPLLLLGFLMARRRSRLTWVVAAAGVAAFYLVHARLADHVLAAHGYEASIGNEHFDRDFVLRALTAGPDLWERAVGFLTLFGGLAGMVAAWRRRDRAARFLLPFALVMIVAALAATRVYWSAVWAVPLAAFVPGLFGANTRTSPSA
jgi:hypothetical protein